MSQFINTIPELRQFVSSVLETVKYSDYAPSIRRVTRYHVEPHFPKTLIVRLLELPTGDVLTSVESDVLEFLRETVSCFAAHEMSLIALKQTATGLQEFQNENYTDGKKYAKEDYRALYESAGYAALESALMYAVEGVEDMGGGYAESNHYAKTVARLVNFTSDFEGSGANVGRKTLMLMLPHIALIEREAVAPVLGVTLYNTLKINQYNDVLTPKQRELLQLYREGIAQYAVQIASDLELVQFVGGHVYEREKQSNDASEQRAKVRTDVYSLVQRTRMEYAARYFTAAKKFLVANATALGWTDTTPSVSEVSPAAFMGFLKK